MTFYRQYHINLLVFSKKRWCIYRFIWQECVSYEFFRGDLSAYLLFVYVHWPNHMPFSYWTRFLKYCIVISFKVKLCLPFSMCMSCVPNNCICLCYCQRPAMSWYNVKSDYIFSVFKRFLSCGISSTLRASFWSMCWGTFISCTQVILKTQLVHKRCF